jgi:hypothetical protein
MTDWLLLTYFVISFCLVIAFGYYQARLEAQMTLDPRECLGDSDLFEILAIVNIVGQALAVLICLGGTPCSLSAPCLLGLPCCVTTP